MTEEGYSLREAGTRKKKDKIPNGLQLCITVAEGLVSKDVLR